MKIIIVLTVILLAYLIKWSKEFIAGCSGDEQEVELDEWERFCKERIARRKALREREGGCNTH